MQLLTEGVPGHLIKEATEAAINIMSPQPETKAAVDSTVPLSEISKVALPDNLRNIDITEAYEVAVVTLETAVEVLKNAKMASSQQEGGPATMPIMTKQ
ncbi:hypothetical protein MBLNU457_3476t1 [Dothideomycetes sp. NU457]